jgi:hypothetical protein
MWEFGIDAKNRFCWSLLGEDGKPGLVVGGFTTPSMAFEWHAMMLATMAILKGKSSAGAQLEVLMRGFGATNTGS